jgi:DNA polymerase-3 subunit epsilon/ribonuclease T
MKALVYDTETGGLDYKKNSLLSIAFCVADLDKGAILDQYSTLVKLPSYNVEQEALNINGLSVAECQTNGEEPAKIGEKMMDAWMSHGCSLLGGHNIHFDNRFVAHWIFNVEPQNLDKIFTHRYLDTYPCIQLMMGGAKAPPGTSLKQCIKFFDINMKEVKGGYHQALFDVIATAKLLIKFRQLLGAST